MAQGNWEGGQVGQGRDVPSDEMPTDSELPSSQNEQVRERKKVVRQVPRRGRHSLCGLFREHDCKSARW